jgi:glucosylceramidase
LYNHDEKVNYLLTNTNKILLTNENGAKLLTQNNLSFESGVATGNVISISPDIIKQQVLGVGTSFTESSAFVLAHLSKNKRDEVMSKIYGRSGANFTLARTPIGATDFCIEGKYSYAPIANDFDLTHFSVDVDEDGFCTNKYSGIKDGNFDLLPMIKQANEIKRQQGDCPLTIIASAWTAPPWMKDIQDWYISPNHENDFQGQGGALKPDCRSTYANYIISYLDTYKRHGVDIWGITPVNEPVGNCGQWESMHFTPRTQNDFIKSFLGPQLQSSDYAETKILIYDQNRDEMEAWTDEILGDKVTSSYVYGTAVHWYESTFKVNQEVLERVHEKFADFAIIHTEGCIDDLGKDAPEGVLDPVKFKEENWFNNDDFWWNKNATDWAYTATWAPKPEDHPIYTPVHRYARNIIVSLNHWLEGWIDWNIVLDKDGGPNHVGNYCGAPIMIDTKTQQVYYTPIYYILAQFSQTIRPKDKVLQVDTLLGDIPEDALLKDDLSQDTLHACATINQKNMISVQILNTSKQPIEYSIQVGGQFVKVQITANALQTVMFQTY